MGSCLDLRKYQDLESKDGAQVADVFSQIVSGKKGYKAVIERKKPIGKCSKCSKVAPEDAKFCPDCGGKISFSLTHCPNCKKEIDGVEKFCTNCGTNLKE